MPDARSFVNEALSLLEAGLGERGSAWRDVQLASVSPEGRPGLRTLVLRGFDRAAATAELHSDSRAGKVREIAYSRHVTLLAWSPEHRLQIRLSGAARLHCNDALAHARWERLSTNARATYGLTADPGTPIEDPTARSNLDPDRQFALFTVIIVAISHFDVLRLEPDGGQTRAQAVVGPGDLAARWVGA